MVLRNQIPLGYHHFIFHLFPFVPFYSQSRQTFISCVTYYALPTSGCQLNPIVLTGQLTLTSKSTNGNCESICSKEALRHQRVDKKHSKTHTTAYLKISKYWKLKIHVSTMLWFYTDFFQILSSIINNIKGDVYAEQYGYSTSLPYLLQFHLRWKLHATELSDSSGLKLVQFQTDRSVSSPLQERRFTTVMFRGRYPSSILSLLCGISWCFQKLTAVFFSEQGEVVVQKKEQLYS